MKWGYKRAFVRCALLFSAGAALQFIFGNIRPEWFRFPLGFILAINYLYVLIVCTAKSDRWTWVRQLTDHHASVSSLASMLIMTIAFGLIRQDGSTDGFLGRIGFHSMSTSWPFCILLFYFITVLGLRAIEEVRHWRRYPLMATVIHAVVFIVLASAFFSSGDKAKVRVIAEVDKPVHTGVYAHNGRMAVLPFVITLKDFGMETYPSGEAKSYNSHILIKDDKGEREANIMVNHPAKVGAWNIYQVSYDTAKGAESNISILECVRDGWYPVVRTGLWIILTAGAFMALTAGYRRRKEDKV